MFRPFSFTSLFLSFKGISSRNSEVIHAGIYYDKDQPLKSRFCVQGKKMMYDYCQERNIPYKRCGKLIVAHDIEQLNVGLPKLMELAKRNGVNDLKQMSKEDVSVMEPNVVCEGAVISPSTGIVDSHALMTSLLAEAEEFGATLVHFSKVEGGHVLDDSIVLDVDGSEIQCNNVVICAGLASDKVASEIISSSNNEVSDSVDIMHNQRQQSRLIPKQYYAKGNYFKLENQPSPFTRLIYPLPDPKGGLGIHATIDLVGSTKFGPDVQWINAANDSEQIDMKVDETRTDSFYDAIRKYWPGLEDGNLVPDYAGLRPKLFHPKFPKAGVIKDFVIAGEDHHGISGLVVLTGIESPGLTSSLAIGDYVADMFR